MVQDDEEVWRKLAFRYSELRDLVTFMRLETQQEARGEKDDRGNWNETTPRWYDEEIDGVVKAWLVLPFIEGLDVTHISERIEWARARIPYLDEAFQKRRLTPEFLQQWGLFCELGGSLAILVDLETSIGRLRSSEESGAAKQNTAELKKRYFAHEFIPNYKRGKRHILVERFERMIFKVCEENLFVGSGFDEDWFKSFLDYDVEHSKARRPGVLRKVYREMTVNEARELVERGRTGLPPSFNSPEPKVRGQNDR